MKSAWMQSAGQLFLIQRYDDGSYGISHDEAFLGFVVRTDHDYVAIASEGGAVIGDAATLGAAANVLAGHTPEATQAVVAHAA